MNDYSINTLRRGDLFNGIKEEEEDEEDGSYTTGIHHHEYDKTHNPFIIAYSHSHHIYALVVV
jgi:hypothetical protein